MQNSKTGERYIHLDIIIIIIDYTLVLASFKKLDFSKYIAKV